MSDAFVTALRAAARACLPAGAFLRRDRGPALFATDAPRRAPDVDWPAILAGAGFECAVEGGIAHLTPGRRWLDALSTEYPEPPDALCARLSPFRNAPTEPAALRLFAEGLKRLEDAGDAGDYDKSLRQLTAVCLREKRPGGGLYACALARYLINQKGC